MKNNIDNGYESPDIHLITVIVEAGYAASGGNKSEDVDIVPGTW